MIQANLVGNPNTGKTTLFNSLTSSNEHVGNWHGVTVEEKAKVYKFNSQEIRLVDLPGIYSLSPLSYEEEVATRYILKDKTTPIINICDASNLERNLYLTLGLMELGCPIILVINQIDKRPNCKINVSKLSSMLGIKVILLNASDKKAVSEINSQLLKLKNNGEVEYNLPYIKEIDFSCLPSNLKSASIFEKIKYLEDDEYIKNRLAISETAGRAEEVAVARYDYIDKVIKACCSEKVGVYGRSKLDKILLNRFLVIPIFLCFMALAFYLTFFSVGKWLSEGLNYLLDRFVGGPLTNLAVRHFGEGAWIVGLIKVALVGGVGSLLSFLPQVAMLFFFLSLLEDSGYLARVAFATDDILGKVGLSGKSIYTLLMGFGCSTTAILTARNMEDKNSKIKTSLLAPYMSCSAKFPIYAVIGGAFFGANNILVIMGLYLLGIVVAVTLSYLFEKSVLKSKEQSFILEFPPYRMISGKRTIKILWQNIKLFVVRVGSLIFAMNIIVWLLSNFSFTFGYVGNGGGSMLEKMGKVIAPVFAPIGFNNWGLVSALIAGLVAKEVVVSSIAMFNGIEGASLDIQKSLLSSSSVVFFAGPCSAISFLVFALLYSPCLASISVLSKEIGKKWTFIGVIVQLLVAYILSFVVYNFSRLFLLIGWGKVIIAICTFAAIVLALVVLVMHIKRGKSCPYRDTCSKRCKKK